MLLEAHTVESDQRLRADVCIVGAGVAGLTLAHELLSTSLRLCILESGGLRSDEATRSLSEGESVGYPYTPLDRARTRGVGGSSRRWVHSLGWPYRSLGARMRPLDAVDFEKREWLADSGWPFGKEHLLPYYRRAQEVFDLRPGTWEPEGGSDPSRGGARREDAEIRTILYRIGPRDPFLVEIPRTLRTARTVSLITGATVLEIETDEEVRNVTALRVAALQGNEFRVTARVYVLAAGGIEVPRLLLLSNRHRPAGLGNEHDLVGRFFMEHPHFTLGRFLPSGPAALRWARYYRVHSSRGGRILGNLAPAEAVIRDERLLNASVGLTRDVPRPPPPRSSRGITSLKSLRSAFHRGRGIHPVWTEMGRIVRDVPGLAAYARRKIRLQAASWLKRQPIFRLGHMTEQSPNPDSRLTLSEKRDRFGQPLARLDWRMREVDLLSVLRFHEILSRYLARSGLGRLEPDRYEIVPDIRVLGGNHHMGTTRMHADHRHGVVDPDCRVYGLSNLFVAGSSVFPTSGCANPTLTIGALTIRLADFLRELLGTV